MGLLEYGVRRPPFAHLWAVEGWRRAAAWVLALVLAGGALRVVGYAGLLAGFPYQVESREATGMRSALALEQGRNPWAPANAPQDYNSYGVLYPWVAAQVLPVSHQGIQDFRAVSLAALAVAAALVGAAAAGLSGSPLVGAAGGLVVLGGYMFGVTPTARCDAFAALFFITPVALLVWVRSRAWLVACALIAALAFFTKPYAAVAGPVVCLLLAGQGRWKAAWAVGLLWAFFLAVLAAGAERIWPGYLEETVLLLAQVVPYKFSYFLTQNGAYLRQAAPLFLLAAAALWRFRPTRWALAWTLPALAMVGLLLWLSWNPGAYLNYHFQLLHPCLVLAVAALWRQRPRGERWLELVLVCCALLNVRYGTQCIHRLAGVDLRPWQAAEALVASARLPLVPALLTSVVTDQGKPVADNGHTEYLRYAFRGPSAAEIRRDAQASTDAWEQRLAQGRVDVVIDDPYRPVPTRFLAGYVRTGQICLLQPLSLGPPVACYDVYRPARPAGRPDQPVPSRRLRRNPA